MLMSMSLEQWRIFALIAGLIVLSGYGDAFGFTHAAQVWRAGQIVWAEVLLSAAGFALGTSIYWVSVRYLQQFSVISAETQVMLWFAVTILGIALLSGQFFRWTSADQMVSLAVLAGIGWLLVRTGG